MEATGHELFMATPHPLNWPTRPDGGRPKSPRIPDLGVTFPAQRIAELFRGQEPLLVGRDGDWE